VREYLMSEAMHYLRVPTTRALSLVSTGDQVLRDMFYNGNAAYEPGAIVMRVAPSFLRFGNFEILTSRQETENLRKLTEWTINKFYPHISGEFEDKVVIWFREVMERTIRMVVEWLRVGFVHGVMNTDNMSILGLTIDYGPFSFLDDYDPNFTPNTTDLPGKRYAFGRQYLIAYWNLRCLGGAISPLVKDSDKLADVLGTYEEIYLQNYYSMMGNKLGLDVVKDTDIALITQVEKTLSSLKPDMTIFYQLLMDLALEWQSEEQIIEYFQDSFYTKPNPAQIENFINLIKAYAQRINLNTCTREDSIKKMQEANPRFILRNYLLHQAIEELENGEQQLFLKLQQAMKEPYASKGDEFLVKRPDWARQKTGCSMLSCSS
jgi:uncharacterized protein YdiU (UPF0061 family)